MSGRATFSTAMNRVCSQMDGHAEGSAHGERSFWELDRVCLSACESNGATLGGDWTVIARSRTSCASVYCCNQGFKNLSSGSSCRNGRF